MSGPHGLAFDSTGNLYASNSNNTIQKFTSGGVGSLFANSGLANPVGLAFDSMGLLYVANPSSNTIAEFTTGGSGSVFANSGLSAPVFIAFGPTPVPVPEPGTALFGIACVGVAALRRRRR